MAEVTHSGRASSFADSGDLAGFNKWYAIYKRQGMTDERAEHKALNHGDNGIGCYGESTKAGSGPCCAIPASRMVERFGPGGVAKAKHKLITVTIGGKSLTLPIKDVQSEDLSTGAIIDLNPDAGAFFGLKPPFLVPATWQWQ